MGFNNIQLKPSHTLKTFLLFVDLLHLYENKTKY